jgi:hypothetical protein
LWDTAERLEAYLPFEEADRGCIAHIIYRNKTAKKQPQKKRKDEKTRLKQSCTKTKQRNGATILKANAWARKRRNE